MFVSSTAPGAVPNRLVVGVLPGRAVRVAGPVSGARPAVVPVLAPPGAHREPGVSFWRIVWREFVWAATWGGVRLWSPPHRA